MDSQTAPPSSTSPSTKQVPPPIEVVQTCDHYILVRGEYSLWFRRTDGSVSAASAWDLAAAVDPVCLGVCDALVGRLQTVAGGDHYLLLVRDSALVGHLPGGREVRKVTRVAYLPLTQSAPADTPDNQLTACSKHSASSALAAAAATSTPLVSSAGSSEAKAGLMKTWGLMKKVTTQVTAATAAAAQSAGAQVKDKVPGLRRAATPTAVTSPVLEELLKLFNDSDSFYFCPDEDGDLTNTLQRKLDGAARDDRFFWNKALTECVPEHATSAWVRPLVQGFVYMSGVLDGSTTDTRSNGDKDDSGDSVVPEGLRLTLISRRSRHQAGTRYKRRGVDSNGWVANYVETEQIASCGRHHLAFVQVRGSVPVFWAQPGYRYRPPPRLEKDAAETQAAFQKHMDAELERFGQIHCVSLIDQLGRERIIGDAYLDHVLLYDSDKISFTSFDFHEQCRGLRFENVAILLDSLSEDIGSAGFTWADDRGALCRQSAVFRTNCIDCLDRTNVVQTGLARAALTLQLSKLGVSSATLPASLRAPFQDMWADNGDALSRQYAGTGALKADFTRTGERKWTGLMRDGVNSANRYYLNRFRDAGRQAAIEASLGRPVEPDAVDAERAEEPVDEEADEAIAVERVRQLLDDCQRLLVPDSAVVLGSWGLIDADPDTGDAGEQEIDTILVLTDDSYYAACYDDDTDRIVSYQRVPLSDLHSLELGALDASRLSRASRPPCLRVWYEICGESGYFHQFRATSLRFFNNVGVSAASPEQRIETLRALAASLVAACEAAGHQVPLSEGRLERRRSRAALATSRRGGGSSQLRWLDEPQEQLKTAGTRAVSSVTSWLPQRMRLWDSDARSGGGKLSAMVAPQSVTERNSPETQDGHEDGGDLIMDSAGIIACSASGTQLSVLPQSGVRHPVAVSTSRKEDQPEEGPVETSRRGGATENGAAACGVRAPDDVTICLPSSECPPDGKHPTDATGTSASETTKNSVAADNPVTVEESSSSRASCGQPPPSTVPDITVSSGAERPSGGLSLLGSALSPLTSPARDTVLVGFSRLARGVQRLGGAVTSSPSAARKLELSDLLRQRIAASRSSITIL